MCGHFTQMLSSRELVALYRLTDRIKSRNAEARYNIAPTQTVPFIRLDDDGEQVVDNGRWWLVPHWAKALPKAAMFNARIETVDTAPGFRDAFKARRCLIPADGFYEWTKADDGGRDPWLIQMPGERPFAFAGLWAHNTKLELAVTSCTIVIAPAVAPISQIHDRMPVILDLAAFDAWLSPQTPIENLKGILLGRNQDASMQFHRVSRAVNKSTFEGRPEPIVNSL
ncbi:SOS response-associated peptidase [Shinella sp. CPCC 100929]|uniref:Abasic site processing protein n=1 Tax=Shinella lacus TaxID=2654216 RepID=A0ABT1RIK1_9HYPH|nr:SOS response-associated peptidase [Shinella lacus]MCQ4635010.1 SOS response-associated peptidase [Shinella lacus]